MLEVGEIEMSRLAGLFVEMPGLAGLFVEMPELAGVGVVVGLHVCEIAGCIHIVLVEHLILNLTKTTYLKGRPIKSCFPYTGEALNSMASYGGRPLALRCFQIV